MKNKVAAARSAKPANPRCAKPRSAKPWLVKSRFTAWPWAARIRNPVLLKTASRTRRANALRRSTLRQYSCGARPMQRGYRTRNPLAVHRVIHDAPVERVRAPESCARRSYVEGNAHTELFAATRAAARASQRSREGGSEMLRVRHIPGNGIHQKIAPKRQGDSQNVSWIEPS